MNYKNNKKLQKTKELIIAKKYKIDYKKLTENIINFELNL